MNKKTIEIRKGELLFGSLVLSCQMEKDAKKVKDFRLIYIIGTMTLGKQKS